MLTLKTPSNGQTVTLQTDAQKQFATEKEEKRRAEMDGALVFRWYDLEMKGVDGSRPKAVCFSWEDDGEDNAGKDVFYYLLVSEREDMKNAWVYITEEPHYEADNFKVGTKYFWCVQKNGKRSDTFVFETLLTLPRCINIDNIYNIRDMGGYKVTGGRIRQGLLYRGAEFELHMNLSEKGAEAIRRLSIRTELDMRGEAKDKVDFTTGELVGLKRVYVPSVPYDAVFEENWRSALKKFFKTFTVSKNYPIYYHCWGGADRTGTFAFIIGAFLGMRYEDLVYEYEFTSLSVFGIRSRNYISFKNFITQFNSLSGNSLQEKATTFLKEYACLSDKQLSDICECLVEKD